MTCHSIYSAQTSRYEKLTDFSHAIEKGKGRDLAFQTLDRQDRLTFLKLNKINGLEIDWNGIEKRQLRGCVQKLLQGLTVHQSQKPIKKLPMATILTHLRRCIKGKHNCKSIGVLLGKVEKFHGKEMRSKLHACIHTVCKKEKALRAKMKIPHFGQKAFIDPKINPKLKLFALDQFAKMVKIPAKEEHKKPMVIFEKPSIPSLRSSRTGYEDLFESILADLNSKCSQNAQKPTDYARLVKPVKNFIVTQVTNWLGDFNAFLSSM